MLGPSFSNEFHGEIKKYNLPHYQQLGYDEALLPDVFDPESERLSAEDEARRAEYFATMNVYQRMAYRLGRVERIELRGVYNHPTQTVFDVNSDPCRRGWSRHAIRFIDAADAPPEWDWLAGKLVGGFRCVYLGDSSDGTKTLQYVNDCVIADNSDENGNKYSISERLALRVIDHQSGAESVVFKDVLPDVDGYTHPSIADARAAALKVVFDDWRTSMYETPDERLVRGDIQ